MLRFSKIALTALILALCVTNLAEAKPKKAKPAKHKKTGIHHPLLGHPHSKYRGWDYLAGQLRKAGVQERDIDAIYQSPEMPRFTFIPFKLKPKESHAIYNTFQKPSFHALGASFLEEHREHFDRMEKQYGVPREVVTAILVIETQVGRHTGDSIIVYRLSRLASVLDPNNVKENYRHLHAQDPSVTMQDVVARGRYLEDTFLPEIPALIEMAKRSGLNVLDIKGSIAGAFGLPQFLPTAYVKFGVDGDGDGEISLFNKVDALYSTGRYLSSFGWREADTHQKQRKVIWNYNKSDAYIDAIFAMSRGIRDTASIQQVSYRPTPVNKLEEEER